MSRSGAVFKRTANKLLTAPGRATPFAFDGAYQDAMGLIYLVNRYYDPSTDQFLSVDPLVDETGQPYVFTNDDPLNATDALGLYSYSYSQPIGSARTVGTAANVMKTLLTDAKKLFPFAITGCKAVKKGAVCTLHPIPSHFRNGCD